jgi:hypothetical protein
LRRITARMSAPTAACDDDDADSVGSPHEMKPLLMRFAIFSRTGLVESVPRACWEGTGRHHRKAPQRWTGLRYSKAPLFR